MSQADETDPFLPGPGRPPPGPGGAEHGRNNGRRQACNTGGSYCEYGKILYIYLWQNTQYRLLVLSNH